MTRRTVRNWTDRLLIYAGAALIGWSIDWRIGLGCALCALGIWHPREGD